MTCTCQRGLLLCLPGSNLNELLAPFSITVEHSTALQAVPGDACPHPTAACIGADGILSKQLMTALETQLTTQQPQIRDVSSLSDLRTSSQLEIS
jgi:hypothetical protein